MRYLLASGFALVALSAQADAPKLTFDDHVAPILRQHCQGCHNNEKQRGGLNLAGYGAMKIGGSSGDVVTPGSPEKSRLYTMTAHEEEPVMPPSGTKIPEAQIATLKNWIELGAAENKGSKVSVAARPKVDIALKAVARGKPEGPPPMPKSVPLEPVVVAKRPGSVLALAASPWAPVVAVGGQKQVVLIHADHGGTLGVLPFEAGQVNSLRFSPSGQFLLAAGGRGGLSGKAVLFEVESGKVVAEVGSEETDAILSADLSPDQSMIAVGTTSRLVRIYQVSDGKVLHTIKKHTDWVTAVEYSPDGVLLATGDRNGGVFVWEADTAREFHTLRGMTQAVQGLSWRADSNLLAAASLDGTARLFEMENGGEVKKWNAHGGGAESVRFLPDGRLATTGRDKLTRLWDADGKQLVQFAPVPDIGMKVAASFDNSKVVVGDWGGTVQIFTSADGKPVATADANPGPLAEQQKQAEAEVAATEALLKPVLESAQAKDAELAAKVAELAKLDADSKTWAAETQSVQAAIAPAEQAIKTATAQKSSLEAERAKQSGVAQVSGQSLAARRLAETAYGRLAAELAEALKKSPDDGELKALADEARTIASAKSQKRAEVEKQKVDADAAVEKLTADLAAVEKSLGESQSKLAQSQKRLGELAGALKAATDRKAALGGEVEAVKKAQAAVAAERAALEGRLAAAKEKLARLQAATARR